MYPLIAGNSQTSKVLNNPKSTVDEPKNILDTVEDDIAAAGQEPKLFLGMVHYKNYLSLFDSENETNESPYPWCRLLVLSDPSYTSRLPQVQEER